jgi:hypothetical protein
MESRLLLVKDCACLRTVSHSNLMVWMLKEERFQQIMEVLSCSTCMYQMIQVDHVFHIKCDFSSVSGSDLYNDGFHFTFHNCR